MASASPGVLSLSVHWHQVSFLEGMRQEKMGDNEVPFLGGDGEVAHIIFPHPFGQHLVTFGGSCSRVQTLELDY